MYVRQAAKGARIWCTLGGRGASHAGRYAIVIPVLLLPRVLTGSLSTALFAD